MPARLLRERRTHASLGSNDSCTLSDNLSANVVGLALGTAFRYWSYRRSVFRADGVGPQGHTSLRRSATAAPVMPTTTQATITANPVQGESAWGAARVVEKL